MKKSLHCLLPLLGALLLLGLTSATRADMSIHVLPRSDAQALVSVIQPLLPEEGYVNAYQGKLIIRTSDRNFQQIQSMLNGVSDQLQTVTVYLRRAGSGEAQRAGAHINQRGVSVTTGRQHHRQQQLYSINTLSGHAAGISQGNLVALAGGYYPALVSLRQGIRVIPQVTAGGQVRLSIAQRFDTPTGHGHADTQDASATLLLTPGQWQPLGAIHIDKHTDSARLDGVSTKSRRINLPLEVKVEVHP